MAFQPLRLMILLILALPFGVGAQVVQSVTVVQWSPDGSMIASGDNSGFLHIWDTTTGQTFAEFQGHESVVTSVSWSPDSTRLASASPSDGLIRIWNVSNGELVAELQGNNYAEGPAFVAWNPSGALLVSISSVIDGGAPLRFWGVENDNYQQLPFGYGVAAYDIAWSPDGKQLAVADFRGIYIFDDFTSTEMEPRVIAPFAFSIAWSPDSSKLAALDIVTGTINILNVNTSEVLMTFQGTPRDLERGIASLSWSPDGIRLAGDGFDGTTPIWNMATGELVQTISLSRAGGRGLLSWSPFGGRIALGNAPSGSSSSPSLDTSQSVISQNIAGGTIQIVVPAPSLELLDTIAKQCNASPEVEQNLTASISSNQLQALTSTVQSLTAEQIPPACAADLLAVAQALGGG